MDNMLYDMEAFEDDLDLVEIVDEGFPRRVYERPDYFRTMDEMTFFKRFRLQKATTLALLEEIEEELEYPNDLNNSVSPINQLLCTLRLYATGGHLSSVADFMGMHISTVSRIVEKVSRVLANLLDRYVYMPDAAEAADIQNRFFQLHSFPRVLGTIDGTHVRIQSPGGEDPLVFMNRKGFYSINVQIVGDVDLKVRDIVARWPGSAHDQTIFFNNSRIKARFETNEFPNSVLLGDSGYAVRNYLLTPLTDPQTPGEQLYNEAQIRTRNGQERLHGIIKRRFPILAYGIRLNLTTALAIIPATAVLYNFAKTRNEEEPPGDYDNNLLDYLIEMGHIEDVPEYNEALQQHNLRRNMIINYFQTIAENRM